MSDSTSKFIYTEPYIYPDAGKYKDYKDKNGNIIDKWCVRYSITLEGKKTEYRREYGKKYKVSLVDSLSIEQREINIKVLLALVAAELSNGIDPKKETSGYKELEKKRIEAEEKYNFTNCLQTYVVHNGYDNPKPFQVKSSKNQIGFLRLQFLPFLEKYKLDKDLRLIKKADIKLFLNEARLQRDWTAQTVLTKKGWLGGFFGALVNEDVIEDNPCNGIVIKIKSAKKEARFNIFTKEEIRILFNRLELGWDINLELACKMLYYAYIRKEELLRLKISNIDLQRNVITIGYEGAKKQNDRYSADVILDPALRECIIRYLKINRIGLTPDTFIFHGNDKNKAVSVNTLNDPFNKLVEKLRKEYEGANLFNRSGLTQYALKHTGVTHLIYDNVAAGVTRIQIVDFVMRQCRHTDSKTTEIYIKKDLGINLDYKQDMQFFRARI